MRAINIVLSIAAIRHGTHSEAHATAVLGHKGVLSLSEVKSFFDSGGRLTDSAGHRHLRGDKSTGEERNIELLAAKLFDTFPGKSANVPDFNAHVQHFANVLVENPHLVLGTLYEQDVSFAALRDALDPLLVTFEEAKSDGGFRDYLVEFIAAYKAHMMEADANFIEKLKAGLR